MNNPKDDTTKISPQEEIDHWQRIKGIISAALELNGSDRDAFLSKACGSDSGMRDELDKLLDAYSGGDSFLEKPPYSDHPPASEHKTLSLGDRISKGTPGSLVAGTILGSRYRIIGLLGKGGMGEVYKAEDIRLSQLVALKFLPGSMENDKDALERFHQEVKVARQVSHPNVCRVFDIGEVDGRHFLSMEFIDGDDLSSLLRRIDRFSPERAIEISRQLCIGLAAIHNQGILHRDFKPANVIIDSQGRIRITDFGIASLVDEVNTDLARAGTPAYMSPEQIRGRGINVRSDIYSLGLVLYEIFTGKPTFRGDSLPELLRKQELESPTTPSVHVKGFDPLIEQIILQCLEKDPSDRPVSALHVAMALPGGNPLQVALEAGQTPSPEMVAAAPKKGAIRPAWALTGLVGGLAMLALCIFGAMKISINNRVPFAKSGEVLSERISEITARLGYTDSVAEKRAGFFYDPSYLNSLGVNPRPEDVERLGSGQPPLLKFREFRNPRYYEVLASDGTLWEPPIPNGSGQKAITVDSRGRLIEFAAAPPQTPSENKAAADFKVAFLLAGLDQAQFREVPPKWTPPVAFSEWRAWEGTVPDHKELALRVEAASFDGKIVFFKLLYPWTGLQANAEEQNTARHLAGLFMMIAVISAVTLAACFLAWRNIRSGSGDRRGAFKVACLVLVAVGIGRLLAMNHIPSITAELARFSLALKSALFYAFFTWVLYLALEPIVRRNLPDLIVSWNRILIGDWRDPLVARDVLIGTLWGVAHMMLPFLGMYTERLVYGDQRIMASDSAVAALERWPSMFLSVIGEFVAIGFIFVCTFSIFFLIVRRRSFAWWAMFGLLSSIEVLFFTRTLVYLPFTLAVCLIWTTVTARVGLVASLFGFVVFQWLESSLLTSNLSAWYSNGMLMTLGVILFLLVYGSWVAGAREVLSGNRFSVD